MAGFPIKFSTTASGMSVPSTVNVAWGRTSVSFSVSASTSMAPQTATIVATAGSATKSSSIAVTSSATYSISTFSCSPAKLIPDQKANCTVYLSAEAPAGGLVAQLSSTSANLKIPSSVAIPATGKGFTFQAVASKTATEVENITLKASVAASSQSIPMTIDPTPKFSFKGNNQEVTLMANGAAVYPTAAPAALPGVLTVRGAGYVAFDPVAGTSGVSFHSNGGQNTDTSYINFTGTGVGKIFGDASEITFLVKSAYSNTERKGLPASNMRSILEVFDNAGSWYSFNTYTSSTGQLQFGFGAQGYSAVYVLPEGQEDQIFGKGITARIRITWTAKEFNLYVNDVLVRTVTVPSPKVANWSTTSALTIGARSSRLSGGGMYASDDAIAELVIR